MTQEGGAARLIGGYIRKELSNVWPNSGHSGNMHGMNGRGPGPGKGEHQCLAPVLLPLIPGPELYLLSTLTLETLWGDRQAGTL